jgi:hypothetical protein
MTIFEYYVGLVYYHTYSVPYMYTYYSMILYVAYMYDMILTVRTCMYGGTSGIYHIMIRVYR